MADPNPTSDTDLAWEEWGRRDPYFGVITNPKFRRSELTREAREEFFASGQWHVDNLMGTIRRHVRADFLPERVLEFGCGVGRLLIPFASIAQEVVGLDVSRSMLLEAEENRLERQLNNVRLLLSDDSLSALTGTFDLIYSFITFQHIAPDRGRQILGKLLDHLAPSGIAVMHFSYSKSHYAPTHGLPPPHPAPPAQPGKRRIGQPASHDHTPSPDPEMQMNPYNMNQLLFLIQQFGIRSFHAEFTDHGGELGIVIYFQDTRS